MIQQYFEDFRAIFPTTRYIEYPGIFLWIQERIRKDPEEIYNKWEDIYHQVETRFGCVIIQERIARFQYLLWKIAHYEMVLSDFDRYCELHQSLIELEAKYRVQGKLCSVLQQIKDSKL